MDDWFVVWTMGPYGSIWLHLPAFLMFTRALGMLPTPFADPLWLGFPWQFKPKDLMVVGSWPGTLGGPGKHIFRLNTRERLWTRPIVFCLMGHMYDLMEKSRTPVIFSLKNHPMISLWYAIVISAWYFHETPHKITTCLSCLVFFVAFRSDEMRAIGHGQASMPKQSPKPLVR